ncbi:MAG: hypothetical protein WCA20_06955 [Candidatus Sulfotelmatobacter sp.]
MHRLSWVLFLIFSGAFTGGQSDTSPVTDFRAASHLFDYDATQSLDVHDKIIEEFDGGTLHDLTYTSPKGGPAAAYLVVPKRKGPSLCAIAVGERSFLPSISA